MKQIFLFSLLLSFSIVLSAQSDKDIITVKTILMEQADSWNKGDIDEFMEAYWQSDQLQFIGSSGITYGWDQTLEGYKKRYSTPKEMGKLSFEIIDVTRRSRKIITLVGKFFLKREVGDLSGSFLLIWQKKKGKWVIVADHTSSDS